LPELKDERFGGFGDSHNGLSFLRIVNPGSRFGFLFIQQHAGCFAERMRFAKRRR
jgi:hypothetical protein